MVTINNIWNFKNKTLTNSLQDVAYALTTTLEEESLSNMDSLVDFYLSNLGLKLAEKGINLDIAQMREEYDKVCWLTEPQQNGTYNI